MYARAGKIEQRPNKATAKLIWIPSTAYVIEKIKPSRNIAKLINQKGFSNSNPPLRCHMAHNVDNIRKRKKKSVIFTL